MTNYCYGRFRVPHAGHDKLFNLSDVVLVSKSPSPEHLELIKKYSGKKVVNITKGSLVDSVSKGFADGGFSYDDQFILGEDNAALGKALVAMGFNVFLVSRNPDSPSSTEIRRRFIHQGLEETDKDSELTLMVNEGWQENQKKAMIAFECWLRGY